MTLFYIFFYSLETGIYSVDDPAIAYVDPGDPIGQRCQQFVGDRMQLFCAFDDVDMFAEQFHSGSGRMRVLRQDHQLIHADASDDGPVFIFHVDFLPGIGPVKTVRIAQRYRQDIPLAVAGIMPSVGDGISLRKLLTHDDFTVKRNTRL